MIKNKIIILACVIVALVVGFVVWFNTPVRFLKDVIPNKISYIEVFNGSTGKSFIINTENEIELITLNIQSKSFERDKVSLGYLGTLYNLKFYDDNDKAIDEFIINGNNTIRKDPFFYTTKSDDMCVELLNELEEELGK